MDSTLFSYVYAKFFLKKKKGYEIERLKKKLRNIDVPIKK